MSNNERDGLDRVEKEIATIDANKRKTLQKIIMGAVYVAPVVTSFAMNKMAFGPALAQSSNTS